MGAVETPVTVDKAFRDARALLEQSGIETADLDATLLLEHASGTTTLMRMMEPNRLLTDAQTKLFADYISRRLAREPAHRIIGSRSFYGIDLTLNEATLVPRPDTEILVDCVLPFVHERIAQTGTCRILDLGTGTGAIALALLQEALGATAVGVDVSARALAAADENARNLGLADRFSSLKSNWFEAVSGQFDLIVSNPPYIASQVIETLDVDVRDHDPAIALDGGTDGLNAYGIIASKIAPYLKKDARIALEIGFDQKNTVSALFEAAGYVVLEARNDLNGQNRVLLLS